MNAARDMLAEVLELRGQVIAEEQQARKAQLKAVDKEIEETLDKIMDSENKSVVRAFEKRMDKLEQRKIVLTERISNDPSKKRGER